MTHDETALARWLDRPGTEPDADLDPEVLEAVYAMRPELAPAPRVSADDILALVTEGPLAAPKKPGLSPGASDGASLPATPSPANRSLATWGGWGGIGLALAAAATFAIVALPSFDSPLREAPPTADQAPAAAAPIGADNAEANKRDAGKLEAGNVNPEPEPEEAQRQNRPKPRPAAAARPAAPPPPPRPVAQAVPSYEMADDAPLREPSLIPELAEDAVVDAAAEVAPPNLDDLRAAAQPADGSSSWKNSVSKAEARRVQGVFDDAAANASDPREAGDIAATVIAAPPAVAHAAALLSSAYYLQAGDANAAASTCLRGLQLRDGSAAWSQLAIRYADLIRNSDPDGAAQWYRDAASANTSR